MPTKSYHFACDARVTQAFAADSLEEAQSQWDTFCESIPTLILCDGQGESFCLTLCDGEPEVDIEE